MIGWWMRICSLGTVCVCVCAYPLSDVQHQFEIKPEADRGDRGGGDTYYMLHALFLHLSVSCVASNTTIAQLRPVVITTQQLVCDITVLSQLWVRRAAMRCESVLSQLFLPHLPTITQDSAARYWRDTN